MYNFNFMYVMKKLLLMLFTISLCFNVFSQDSTYTYEKYGVINQYTNNMVLEVDDILRFSKHKLKNENCFISNNEWLSYTIWKAEIPWQNWTMFFLFR